MTHAEYHPEHDRTSCDDDHLNNITAEGSTGCARCTALALDRGAKARVALVQRAAEAHTNLNTWAAIITLLESGLLYGNSREHKAATRVIKIARAETSKFVAQYDAALSEHAP